MFMMPTPPTTQRDHRHASSRLVIRPVVEVRALGHLGHVADGEVLRLAGADAVAFAQQRRDLLDGRRDLGWRERAATRIWSTLAKRTGMGRVGRCVADGAGIEALARAG